MDKTFRTYAAPELEVISTVVERGFELSYGRDTNFIYTEEDDDLYI